MTKSIYKRVLLLAAVVLVLGVAEAQATARPFGAYEAGLFRLGLTYWQETPRGCPYITREVEPRWEGLEGAVGEAGNCRMVIAEDAFAADADPRETCAVVVHEVGHLNGHGHSPDPTNVMYTGYFTDTLPGLPICADPPASIAALPPETFALWPAEVEALNTEEARWGKLRARCPTAGRRCWPKARRLRSRLSVAWPPVLARRYTEPVYN